MNIAIKEYCDSYYEMTDQLLFKTFGYHKSNISDSNVYEFVSLLDNQVVGYFSLCRFVDVVRNIIIFHVDYVCVDEEYRGMKIGKQMMEYAISFAKENGATRMELTSGNSRIAAHKLYESLDFVKRDTTVFRKELL